MKKEIINGVVYTPIRLVEIAINWLKDLILPNDVILDLGSGKGAFCLKFAENFKNNKVIGIELDDVKIDNEPLPNLTIYNNTNAFDFNYYVNNYIIIGNPPYRDATALYQKSNLKQVVPTKYFNNDLGIAFFNLYAQIKPKYVCVIFPFSFLIKESKFKQLKNFTKTYSLLKGIIFSSHEFTALKKQPFACCLALFAYDENGMNFNNIRNFKFDILNSNKQYCLKDIHTIAEINLAKYPNKDKRDTDLFFYTLRDMNALKRNKTFYNKNIDNVLSVKQNDLYKYAWIDYLKNHYPFNYLTSNNEILWSNDIVEVKDDLIAYVCQNNKVVYDYYKNDLNMQKYYCYIINYEKLNHLIKSLERF